MLWAACVLPLLTTISLPPKDVQPTFMRSEEDNRRCFSVGVARPLSSSTFWS